MNESRELTGALSAIFETVERSLGEGITTESIDPLVQVTIQRFGVESAFVGYRGYRHHTITSINNEAANNPPSQARLFDGDILKVQIGIKGKTTFAIQGWTYPIASVSTEDRRLMSVGRDALRRAVGSAIVGARTGDISAAIQATVEDAGFEVNRDFVGFAIDLRQHAEPPIPGYGRRGTGPELFDGQILCLFSIVHAGSCELVDCPGGPWGMASSDGSRSALFSQMVVVRTGTADVLTPERVS